MYDAPCHDEFINVWLTLAFDLLKICFGFCDDCLESIADSQAYGPNSLEPGFLVLYGRRAGKERLLE